MSRRHATAFGIVLLCSACAGEPRPAERDAAEATMLPDSVLVQQGEAAATRLAGGLLAPLTAAVEAGGPASAIDFCSREALRLTAAIQDSIGRDVRLGRTTLQSRNPANAPDSLDRVVLQQLHDAAAQEQLPQHVLVHDGEYARFYRPLRIQPLCLQCHGDEAALDPEVKRLLAERYPDDSATGYQAGDLRGAIRVVLPRAPVH